MKFPKLTALAPAGESFDETALNEGIWVTGSHLESVEKALAGNDTALQAVNASLETATAQLTESNAKITGLEESAATSATTITTQAARIKELEAENAELGKKPSGKGTTLTTKKDAADEPAEVPSYLDANNPANAWFDKQTKYR
jgi:chromosome segregation ATPase